MKMSIMIWLYTEKIFFKFHVLGMDFLLDASVIGRKKNDIERKMYNCILKGQMVDETKSEISCLALRTTTSKYRRLERKSKDERIFLGFCFCLCFTLPSFDKERFLLLTFLDRWGLQPDCGDQIGCLFMLLFHFSFCALHSRIISNIHSLVRIGSTIHCFVNIKVTSFVLFTLLYLLIQLCSL
jgi:hypothetical protein